MNDGSLKDLNFFADSFMPKVSESLYKIPEMPISKSDAEHTYDRLVSYITDFEKDLDNDHEIGARLVSFGETTTFHIQDIGYWGPNIITFTGLNSNGEKVKLIQNTAQLSVLLVAMKKLGDKPKRVSMGFSKS